MEANPYDVVPYKSHPFHETRPQHLYAMASLYGLDAVDYTKARVLELGCASGGNITPLAAQYPAAFFVGVDYSKKQIDEGLADVKHLGLSNIELKGISILDIDQSFGEFDYIIVHGVYSWVPNEVRYKILDICQNNLSANGVAFISYNTKPGWNSVLSFREIMRQHTRQFSDPITKSHQVRELANFLKRAAPDQNSSWAKLLETEINNPGFQEDSYIFHEYLEDDNVPYYFTEFMQDASRYQLQHLLDLDCFLYSPYLLNSEASAVIREIPDKIEAEQYIDYITSRRFRKSLLCHADRQVDTSITTQYLDRFKFYRSLKLETPVSKEQLKSTEPVNFIGGKIKIASSEPAIKTAFEILTRPGNPIEWRLLLEKVKKSLPEMSMPEIETSMSHIQFDQLIALNVLELTLREDPVQPKVSKKPCASPYARHQAVKTNILTNLEHQLIALDTLGCILMPLVDGTHSIDELKKLFSQMIRENESDQFEYFVDDQLQVINKKDILANIGPLTENYLESMAAQNFLQS